MKIKWNRPIKVLIIDDSAFIRQFLSRIFHETEDFQVLAAVSDPTKAVKILKEESPDVITLDVEMPNMDGLEFLRYLMRFKPIPVVMISSWTSQNSEIALKALSLGAVDYVAKPTVGLREGMAECRNVIITKVKAAATARIKTKPLRRDPLPSLPKPEPSGLTKATDKVIAIGASTGGTVALTEIFKDLRPETPGIIIIQHMPKMFTASFASSLQQVSRLRVSEARGGEVLTTGQALLVPGGKSLTVKKSGAKYVVEVGPSIEHSIYNPSIDYTLFSVAKAAGPNAMGIILTGMGDDGAKGLKAMREWGAYTIAQDEESSVIYGMPKKAWENQGAIKQAPLSEIAGEIHRWAGIS
ncbi:MAG TPA: chemotaxis response regulator protein-glutamate methylesterase [Firmicutes bacterium]|jgi:two-component system chemotaxis response regulator CheB|nr:chemotaxis response regulator protein-glutamate methylesterase [Bacillota bacterium]